MLDLHVKVTIAYIAIIIITIIIELVPHMYALFEKLSGHLPDVIQHKINTGLALGAGTGFVVAGSNSEPDNLIWWTSLIGLVYLIIMTLTGLSNLIRSLIKTKKELKERSAKRNE